MFTKRPTITGDEEVIRREVRSKGNADSCAIFGRCGHKVSHWEGRDRIKSGICKVHCRNYIDHTKMYDPFDKRPKEEREKVWLEVPRFAPETCSEKEVRDKRRLFENEWCDLCKILGQLNETENQNVRVKNKDGVVEIRRNRGGYEPAYPQGKSFDPPDLWLLNSVADKHGNIGAGLRSRFPRIRHIAERMYPDANHGNPVPGHSQRYDQGARKRIEAAIMEVTQEEWRAFLGTRRDDGTYIYRDGAIGMPGDEERGRGKHPDHERLRSKSRSQSPARPPSQTRAGSQPRGRPEDKSKGRGKHHRTPTPSPPGTWKHVGNDAVSMATYTKHKK